MTDQGNPRSWPATEGLLVAGWVALAATVVGWGWLLTNHLEGSIGAGDDDLARWVADGRTAPLTDAAEIGTFVGDTIVGAVVLSVAAVMFSIRQKSWLPLHFVALVEVGIFGIYWFGTTLDPRQRPPVEILDRGLVPDHSFPSGHTATSMAIFLGLAFLIWTYTRLPRGWALVLALVPLACATARLYQGAHHLSDVLTSVVYTTVWITLVARLSLRSDARRFPG